jgi:hypothetical protein
MADTGRCNPKTPHSRGTFRRQPRYGTPSTVRMTTKMHRSWCRHPAVNGEPSGRTVTIPIRRRDKSSTARLGSCIIRCTIEPGMREHYVRVQREGALRRACYLMRQNCVVRFIDGPNDEESDPVALTHCARRKPVRRDPVPQPPTKRPRAEPAGLCRAFVQRVAILVDPPPTVSCRDLAPPVGLVARRGEQAARLTAVEWMTNLS